MTERLSEQQRVVNPEKLIQWFRKKYRTSTMNNESAYNWSKEYFQKTILLQSNYALAYFNLGNVI